MSRSSFSQSSAFWSPRQSDDAGGKGHVSRKSLLLLIAFTVGFVFLRDVPHLSQQQQQQQQQEESRSLPVVLQQRQIELERWLSENSDTPAARYVHLLREHLHVRPGAEFERIQACNDRSWVHCFGGSAAAAAATGSGARNKNNDNDNNNMIHLQRTTEIPLRSDVSVYQLYHFSGTDNPIVRLGTDPVCLPLILAGAAVGGDDWGVVVELGTFVGFSSRCLGMGLNSTGQTGAFYAFDGYTGKPNYNAITRAMPWVLKERPDYSPAGSFRWLWEAVMEDAYPSYTVKEGWITPKTVNRNIWNNRRVAVLSIDSIKSWNSWQDQLAGLGDPLLEKGSILSLMDFSMTDQVNIVFGCLSGEYLRPIYTSWCPGEHMIFLVLKTIPQNAVSECTKDLLQGRSIPPEEDRMRIQTQVERDLSYLTDLQESDSNATWSSDEAGKCLYSRLTQALGDGKWNHWGKFKR